MLALRRLVAVSPCCGEVSPPADAVLRRAHCTRLPHLSSTPSVSAFYRSTPARACLHFTHSEPALLMVYHCADSSRAEHQDLRSVRADLAYAVFA
eukprot:268719-Rhodomonas_salina.4